MPSLAAENKRYFGVRDNINTYRDVKDADVGVSNVLNTNSDSCGFGAGTDEETDDLRGGDSSIVGGEDESLQMQTGSWRSDMHHETKAAYSKKRPHKLEKSRSNQQTFVRFRENSLSSFPLTLTENGNTSLTQLTCTFALANALLGH